MASPYLERRVRSYREALREIRRKQTARLARKARDHAAAASGKHLRLIHADPGQHEPGERDKQSR